MTKTNRIGMLLLSGALAITAAACSSDDADDEQTGDTAALAEDSSDDAVDEDAADTEEPVEPEEVEPEEVEPVNKEPDEDPEPEPDEPDPVSGGTEACLIGEWEADNEYFLAQMQDFGDVIDDLTGRVTLNYAPDGTFTTHYDDWTITGSTEGQPVSIHRTGVDEGIYTVNGDTITFEDTNMGSTMTISAAGMNMTVDPDAASYTEATFTCDASTVRVVTTDGDMILTR